MKKSLLFLFIYGISSTISWGQSLDQIGKDKKILKVNGGVSTSHVFYAAAGLESRRNPYDYFVTGNLGFDLYGWSVPFSFTFSNQQVSFQQPFNQYGLHPSYKWVKAHIGWNSMSFSSYSLAGHIYNGLGLELTLNDWLSVSAMYGRLQKAVEYDSTQTNNQPAYRRMGTGVKVGLKKNKDLLELIAFRAWDDPNSIAPISDSLQLLAQENLVLSVHATKSIKKAILDLEFASTAITEDLRASEADSVVRKTLYSYLGNLFTPRQSTGFYNALKSSLSYPFKFFTIGGTYERVEPGYRTLGAYFFNNDLENITLNFSTAFYQSRITLALSGGTQRNDLYNRKASQMRRLVGSSNLGLTLSNKANLNLSYSNFQSFTNIRPIFDQINQTTPFQNLDTLNYRQISQNLTLSFNYTLSKSKESNQMLITNLAYQTSKDEQGGVEQNTGLVFYNANISHSLSFTGSGASITTSFALNRNETLGQSSSTWGPTIGFGRPFFKKKLKTTLSSSFNNAYQQGQLTNNILNVRLNANFTLKKKHNFSGSIVALRRNSQRFNAATTTLDKQAFTEFTGTIAYSYSF